MPSKFLPRDRAWGTRYATLGSSPPSSPTLQRPTAAENVHSSTLSPTSPPERKHSAEGILGFEASAVGKADLPDTTPHDASIFVGSLPANVDHVELSRRLYDHLSAYPQIKGVKVVRDSRGGVCAFIQCDTPLAAGELLHTLQAQPPLPFLGRFLRFEPAKAYRTLLLSYRTPAGFVSTHTDGLSDEHSATKSQLAYAMRIYRPRNAKFLGLVYDEDATKFNSDTATESTGNVQHDRFLGEGFLISPLKYDEETLRALAAAFGPLESFKEHVSDSCPSPHDAPRSPEMAKGVWEIKWTDREDSVAALLTLRRVPHLIVSWAHHPPSNANPGTRFGNQQPGLIVPTSPWSPTVARYGSNVRAEHERNRAVQLSSVVLPLIQVPPPPTPSSAPCPANPTKVSSVVQEPSITTSPSQNRDPVHVDSTRWADQMADLDFSVNGALSPQSSLQTSTPVLRQQHGFAPSSFPQEANEPIDRFVGDSAQDLRPTDTRLPPMQAMNRTPGTGLAARDLSDLACIAGERRIWTDHAASPPFLRNGRRELDPTTVFVGGLEVSGPEGWDDNKLRRIFGRFGNIESIHLVAPLNKRSAFAFIKFTNDASASRAVREEHNHIYGGRPIRVQLRERVVTPRGPWRPGRGRGRGIFPEPPHFRQGPTLSSVVCPGADVPVDANDSESGVGYTGLPQNAPARTPPHHDMSSATQPTDIPPQGRAWPDRFNNSFSSLSSSTTKVPSVNYELSLGPPSTTASLTPPPSSVSASSSLSSTVPAQYSMNMGFFPPQQWVQPYPTAYPYPVPVVPGYGYPGYPYAPVHAMAPTFHPNALPSSDSTNSRWPGLAGSESPAKERTGPVGPLPAPMCHATQPPLRATGFIQNVHGALVPVYQREALDEYMANAHGRQPPPATAGAQSQSVPQPGNVQTAPDGIMWQPPPLAMYPGPYPVHVQSVPQLPGPQAHLSASHQPRFWMPGAVPYGVPAFHPQGHHPAPGPAMPAAAAPVSSHQAMHVAPSGQAYHAPRSR